MQENHPGTVISIKTYHTLNHLYNTARRAIARIRSRGVLDTDDCHLLEQSLRDMHVHLHLPSTMPPPAPILAIRHLPWLAANDQLSSKDKQDIEQILLRTDDLEGSLLHAQSFSWLDYLWHKNEPLQGVYLLVSGLVEEWKLEPYDIDASTSEVRWKENARTRQTTLVNQQIFSPQHGKHLHYSSEIDSSKSQDDVSLKYSFQSVLEEEIKSERNQNYRSRSVSHQSIGKITSLSSRSFASCLQKNYSDGIRMQRLRASHRKRLFTKWPRSFVATRSISMNFNRSKTVELEFEQYRPNHHPPTIVDYRRMVSGPPSKMVSTSDGII